MTAPHHLWSLLNTDVRDLFKKTGRLVDDPFLEELLGVLITTDMGAESAQAIIAEVAAGFLGRVIRMEDLLGSVKATLKELMPG